MGSCSIKSLEHLSPQSCAADVPLEIDMTPNLVNLPGHLIRLGILVIKAGKGLTCLLISTFYQESARRFVKEHSPHSEEER